MQMQKMEIFLQELFFFSTIYLTLGTWTFNKIYPHKIDSISDQWCFKANSNLTAYE